MQKLKESLGSIVKEERGRTVSNSRKHERKTKKVTIPTRQSQERSRSNSPYLEPTRFKVYGEPDVLFEFRDCETVIPKSPLRRSSNASVLGRSLMTEADRSVFTLPPILRQRGQPIVDLTLEGKKKTKTVPKKKKKLVKFINRKFAPYVSHQNSTQMK